MDLFVFWNHGRPRTSKINPKALKRTAQVHQRLQKYCQSDPAGNKDVEVRSKDDVRAVPYWVDDPSLKASIEESGGGALLLEDGDRLDANKAYGQLLPYGEIAQARRATVQVTVTDHD